MDSIHLQELEDPNVQRKRATNKISLIMKKKLEKKPSTRKLIVLMAETNTKLEQDIQNVNSVGNCRRQVVQVNVISDLIKELENVDDELKSEKGYLADLQNEIHQSHFDFSQFQRQSTDIEKKSLAHLHQESFDTEKSRDVMLQKLNVANVQLSQEHTKNAELRAKIQVLMNARKTFNKDYDMLLDKLKYGKQVMEDLKSSLNRAVVTKQNIQQGIEKLNIKENKQRKIQEEEANDLEQRKNQESILRSYFERKLETRKIIQLDTKERRSKLSNNKKRDKLLNDLKILKECVSDIFGINFVEDNIIFKDAVKEMKCEDSNFASLLVYLIQLNSELEALKEKVFNQENEIREKITLQDEIEEQQEERVKHLRLMKNEYTETYIALLDALEFSKRSLAKLFKEITSLIEITNTDVTELLKLLGENNSVNVYNYKFFLESLETKLILLMQNTAPECHSSSKKPFTSTLPKQGMAFEESFIKTATPTLLVPCFLCYPAVTKNIT